AGGAHVSAYSPSGTPRRSHRRWKAIWTCPLEALGLFTRHFAIPPGMMEARPLLADRAPRHCRKRSGLGNGPEIDMADDRGGEEGEGHVVEDPGKLPPALSEAERDHEHPARSDA